MHWADVTARPLRQTIRQFAVLFLVVFGGFAAWRAWHGDVGGFTKAMAFAAVGIGGLGAWRPEAIRFVYTGWMIVAFPIGWTVSHALLAALYYFVFSPVAVVFRLVGRDALNRRRRQVESYWTAKAGAVEDASYFRQS